MLLKIFIKRLPHGELIDNPFEANNWLIEGDEIFWKDNYEEFTKSGLPAFKSLVGRTFTVKKKGEIVSTIDFYPDSQGYEIVNAEGVVTDRFITTTN